jgi:hypothetical protein
LEDVEIRIANITFGFDNKELLLLLKERGSYVAVGKFEKLPAINEKIQKAIEEKRTKFIRPVTAFITFERQEGRDRAIKHFCDPKLKKKEEEVNPEVVVDTENARSRAE